MRTTPPTTDPMTMYSSLPMACAKFFLVVSYNVSVCVCVKIYTSFVVDKRLILSISGGLLSAAFAGVVSLTSAVVISNQVLV